MLLFTEENLEKLEQQREIVEDSVSLKELHDPDQLGVQVLANVDAVCQIRIRGALQGFRVGGGKSDPPVIKFFYHVYPYASAGVDYIDCIVHHLDNDSLLLQTIGIEELEEFAADGQAQLVDSFVPKNALRLYNELAALKKNP